MDSPGLESPLDGDEIFPCKGCGEILEEGKAFELAGNRWHLNCFRCNTCSTLLDSDANLLLLGDGSLICNNCTYSCHSCHNKIEDLAILTGDQAYCASCFRCRNCKRKIENLRYARTSQGIFCMSCHESLMARRRKKSKAAAQSRSSTKEKESKMVDKSLPALPPNALPSSAFSPIVETPDSLTNDTPTELSPRPRTGFQIADAVSRSSSSRPESTEKLMVDTTLKETLTLPNSTYRTDRQPSINGSSEMDADDGEGFFIPLALDNGLAPTTTPRSAVHEVRDSVKAQRDSRSTEKDYFGVSKNVARQTAREQEATPTATTPHIAFQEKSRRPSSDYAESPLISPRKTLQASPNLDSDSINSNSIKATNTGLTPSASEQFRLQEVPKNKKNPTSRTSSQTDITSEVGTPKTLAGVSRKELPLNNQKSDSPKGLALGERIAPSRTSQDSRPSLESSTSKSDPRGIVRKEIPYKTPNGNSTSDLSSSASSTETPGATPTVNGKSISAPVVQSSGDDPALPARAPTRPGPPIQKLSDSFMAPRAPPAPPASIHKISKSSLGPTHEPVSPKLPRWSSGGDFTMDEDMARILGGTDEGAKSIMRRVSNAVRHGRTGSEQSKGHGRSISETTRGTASPRWPKTPIAETDLEGARNISSPISIASPMVDDPALLRRQLLNSEHKVAELERQVGDSSEIRSLNKKLIEKRRTVTTLESQAELMIRQIETLAEAVEHAKESDRFDIHEAQEKGLEEYKRKVEHLTQTLSHQVERLIEERDNLEEQKMRAQKDRDRALVEFEQLSSKNAQLADLNNDLTHQIQERFKAQSGSQSISMDSPRPSANGLGIYTHHNKAKSTTSMHTDDLSMRPSTGTTLQGSTIGAISSYPQQLEREAGVQPATYQAPQIVEVRKVARANKLGNVAKGVAKGFGRAFGSGQDKHNNQYAGQIGDNIGLPYDATMVPVDNIGPGSMPRSASNDPRQGGFNIFSSKKLAAAPKASSSTDLGPVLAEPPHKLFGSYLVERADYERAQIPSIVTRCIEEVQLRGMDVEGIYRKGGGNNAVKDIQAGFEKSTEYDGISDPDVDITAVTSAFKQYLRKLPVPLIPFDAYDQVMASKDIKDSDDRCTYLRDTFALLPAKHQSCLEYLIFHLFQVSEKSDLNKMNARNIGVVFAPTIMRSPDLDREATDVVPRNDVMEFIIKHCDDIFNPE